MGGMTQEIIEIFIQLASSLGNETAQKTSLCFFRDVKRPLRRLAYLYYPWLATWTPEIRADELVSGWGKKKDVSQIHESSLYMSQLFLSQQVVASVTVSAIIVPAMVAGFIWLIVLLLCHGWQSLFVQTIYV